MAAASEVSADLLNVEPRATRSGSVWIYGPSEDINKHYKLGQQLGQPGQFGRAVKATKLKPVAGDPAEFAVKIISKARFKRSAQDVSKVFDSFRNEVEIMARLDHPNVIKFFEVYEDQVHFYIVMELCSGGELFDRITARGQFNEKEAASVLLQIFKGLDYMHRNKIAHCDLKPDNFIFLSKADTSPVKIIDFGMSKLVKTRKYFKKFCGTPYYVAPEVLDNRYNEACDMWSMGVVMFVMLHGYPPFHADPAKYGNMADEKIFQLIRAGFNPVVKKGYKNHFPEAIPISAGARDLITKLLDQDTKKRLTASEALEHPWLTGHTAPQTPLPMGVVKSLKSFSQVNRFKTEVLDLMASTLSEEEVSSLKASFEAMDENGDGTLQIHELEKALSSADSSLKKSDIEAIMRQADLDGDGSISYKELLLTYTQKKLGAKEERLWDTFCKLDVDGDGKISIDEIKSVLSGGDLEVAKELVAQADKDGNGIIDYDEFLNLWSDAPANNPLPAAPSIKLGPSMSDLRVEENKAGD